MIATIDRSKSGSTLFEVNTTSIAFKTFPSTQKLPADITKNFEKEVKQRIASLTKRIVTFETKSSSGSLEARHALETEIKSIESIILM